MKTFLIELTVKDNKETKHVTVYDTKDEAERIAKIRNENRSYNFTDQDGNVQRLFFYTSKAELI